MRRSFLMIGLLVVLLTGCAAQPPANFSGITGSGAVITEKRSVSGFHAVSVSSNITLQLTQTGDESLTIEAEDNIMPLLVSEVSEDTLSLGLKPHTSVRLTQPVVFKLTVKDLDAIRVHDMVKATLGPITAGNKFSAMSSDSAALTLDRVTAGSFELKAANTGTLRAESLDGASTINIAASSTGNVKITSLTASILNVTTSEAAVVKLAGKVDTQHVTAKGVSWYVAGSLGSKVATILASDGANVTVSVDNSLNATAGDNAKIHYSGNAQVTQKTSASGLILKQ